MTKILSEIQQAKSRREKRSSRRDSSRHDVENPPPSSNAAEMRNGLKGEELVGNLKTYLMNANTNALKSIGKEKADGTIDTEAMMNPPESAASVMGSVAGTQPALDLAEAVEIQDDETKTTTFAQPHKADNSRMNRTRRRFQLYLVIIAIALIIATAAVVGGILLARGNSKKETSPPEPTASPTSQGAYHKVFISVAGDDIWEPGHPTYLAKEWIMNEDPMELPPDAPNLAQRFILASFYFSAFQEEDGTAWGDCKKPGTSESAACSFRHACIPFDSNPRYAPSTRWLSDENECDWAGILCTADYNVRSIQLCENNIAGPIPSFLSALDSLTVLDLSVNRLTGTLPSALGGLYQLQALMFHGNELVGTIPDEYWSLGGLEVLDLAINGLTGTLNPNVGQLKKLKGLHVYHNELGGPFPATVAELTDLAFLRGVGNSFIGTVHSEFGKLTKLEEFRFAGNGLNGTIPTEVGGMRSLTDLDLSYNNVGGTIPGEVYELNLMYLFLNDMFMSGTISPSIGSLTRLRQLGLSHNSLSGTIPTELGLCTDLTHAWLDANELTGSMPDAICENRKVSGGLGILQSDCLGDPPEVECLLGECCTACCAGADSCVENEV